MTHLKRYFWDVCNAGENHIDRMSDEYIFSASIVYFIGEIFHDDGRGTTPEERGKSRKSGSIRENFDGIKKPVDGVTKKLRNAPILRERIRPNSSRQSNTPITSGKFERIMEDGIIPLDNSDAERSVRDFAVLRGSTGSGAASNEGAKALAIFASFHKTCKKKKKKNGVRLEQYLKCLFRHIGKFKDKLDDKDTSDEEKKSILKSCMPWNFCKS